MLGGCLVVSKAVAVPLGNVLLAGPRFFSGVHLVLPSLSLASHAAELPLHAYLLGLRHRGYYQIWSVAGRAAGPAADSKLPPLGRAGL